jgi:hypothetical protein
MNPFPKGKKQSTASGSKGPAVSGTKIPGKAPAKKSPKPGFTPGGKVF